MKLKIICLPNKIYKNRHMYFDAFKIHYNYIHLELHELINSHYIVVDRFFTSNVNYDMVHTITTIKIKNICNKYFEVK